ncbi:MAG: hypothetical protein ABF807_06480 [Liquorilactobacillus nagelii]|uniref:hypothetical protein n=1 Tax=Liquorilactobacillus nagelii TaxID=82688 RepID=UPI0039E77FAE
MISPKNEEKAALINNELVTEKLLYKRSCELTNISQELQVITDLLDQFNYSHSKKDKFAVEYFLSQERLSNAIEVLQNIKHEIDDVSNSICPDED